MFIVDEEIAQEAICFIEVEIVRRAVLEVVTMVSEKDEDHSVKVFELLSHTWKCEYSENTKDLIFIDDFNKIVIDGTKVTTIEI